MRAQPRPADSNKEGFTDFQCLFTKKIKTKVKQLIKRIKSILAASEHNSYSKFVFCQQRKRRMIGNNEKRVHCKGKGADLNKNKLTIAELSCCVVLAFCMLFSLPFYDAFAVCSLLMDIIAIWSGPFSR